MKTFLAVLSPVADGHPIINQRAFVKKGLMVV